MTLDKLKQMLDQYIADGADEHLIHATRLAVAREGRRLAKESNGELGWCSFHKDLHPAFLFTRDSRRGGSGIQSACAASYHERRAAVTKPAPLPPVPEPDRKARKCRKCKSNWIPAEGDKKERCPGCRAKRGSR